MNRRKFLVGMLAAQVGVGVIAAAKGELPTQTTPIPSEGEFTHDGMDTEMKFTGVWKYTAGNVDWYEARLEHQEAVSRAYARMVDEAIMKRYTK
jgi:hypothetical protein